MRAEGPRPFPASRADKIDTTIGQVISPKKYIYGVLIGWLNALGKGLELLASIKKKAWSHWQGMGRGQRVGEQEREKNFGKTVVPCKESTG